VADHNKDTDGTTYFDGSKMWLINASVVQPAEQVALNDFLCRVNVRSAAQGPLSQDTREKLIAKIA
jgi:hypothetical protein